MSQKIAAKCRRLPVTSADKHICLSYSKNVMPKTSACEPKKANCGNPQNICDRRVPALLSSGDRNSAKRRRPLTDAADEPEIMYSDVSVFSRSFGPTERSERIRKFSDRDRFNRFVVGERRRARRFVRTPLRFRRGSRGRYRERAPSPWIMTN